MAWQLPVIKRCACSNVWTRLVRIDYPDWSHWIQTSTMFAGIDKRTSRRAGMVSDPRGLPLEMIFFVLFLVFPVWSVTYSATTDSPSANSQIVKRPSQLSFPNDSPEADADSDSWSEVNDKHQCPHTSELVRAEQYVYSSAPAIVGTVSRSCYEDNNLGTRLRERGPPNLPRGNFRRAI